MQIKIRPVGLATAALVLSILVSSCGSDDSQDGGASGSTDSTITQADVAPYFAGPDSVGVTVPLARPAPAGKKIIWLSVGFAEDKYVEDGFEEAAKLLRWTVTNINIDLTNPPTIKSSLDSAIAQGPDAIIIPGLARQEFESAVSAAKEAGIALIPYQAPVDTDPAAGVHPVLNSSVQGTAVATAVARAVLADAGAAGENAQVLQLTTPEIVAIQGPLNRTVESEIKKNCATCTYDLLDVTLADLLAGRHVQSVVSYLQTHPDVTAIVADTGLLGTGLDGALAQAGLSDVTVYGFDGSKVQLEAYRNGAAGAWAFYPFPVWGWQIADHVARVLEEGDTDVWSDVVTFRLINADNVGEIDAELPVFPEGYRDEFKRLWGV